MDKKKQNKDEKIGPDGLTKKERRALKLQARQTDDSKVELKNMQSNKKPNEIEQVQVVEKVELSEKEKRKLEWEKKLAEQKNELNKETPTLSKADQKAKRRELQEAQRSAKTKIEIKAKTTEKTLKIEVTPKTVKTPSKTPLPKRVLHTRKVQLLHHLYAESKSELDETVCYPNIHPAFVQLGVQYSTRKILGSNARCVSLLIALDHLIKDIKTPPQHEFCRYLESVLQKCSDYLQSCRPMAVSMINALRLFKWQLTQIDNNLSDESKRAKLSDYVKTYVQDEILTAGRAISLRVLEKISDGDTILIYGHSSVVKKILVDAFLNGKKFQVIVADGRSLFEGREMLRKLRTAGIKCTYIQLNSLSYLMSSVTKVLIGAHALLANGYVMSRAGTAQVALVAAAFNKSVLLCCETHKFTERAQADSMIYNEIGDPESLIDTPDVRSPIRLCRNFNKLTPLNLMFDVTPSNLVSAVFTELAILPCSSVPVVLRMKPIDV